MKIPARLALVAATLLLALPTAARAVEPGLAGQWHFDSYTGTGINLTTKTSTLLSYSK